MVRERGGNVTLRVCAHLYILNQRNVASVIWFCSLRFIVNWGCVDRDIENVVLSVRRIYDNMCLPVSYVVLFCCSNYLFYNIAINKRLARALGLA